MAEDRWRETQLGDVVTFQRGFDITKREQTPGPFPIISSSGQSSTHTEFKVEGPGVVIGRKGKLGGVYYSEGPYWPHDTTLWVKDFRGNDPKFVYYFLPTLDLGRFDVGAANPTLNRNHIHPLPVKVPHRATQSKIAGILSAYDDLIANNTRRIAILERMARTIYREWFVEFRYPGHEEVPLVGSELGSIPDGWQAGCLADGVEIVRKNISATALNDQDVAHYSFEAHDRGRLPLIESGTDLLSGKLVLEEDSVLIAKLNPKIKRVWMAYVDPEPLAVTSGEFLVLRPHSGWTLEYLCGLVDSVEFQSAFTTYALGTSTSHQRVKPSDALGIRLAVPREEIIGGFSAFAGPIYGMAHTLRLQNERLSVSRDLLLPRLMSGEIDVSELDIDPGVVA